MPRALELEMGGQWSFLVGSREGGASEASAYSVLVYSVCAAGAL